MSTKTSNFEYIKPGEDEFYNITEFNQTLDKIDADMKALKDTEENHTDNATVHVTAEDKESWNTSLENKTLTYTESSTIQDLNSGEKLSIAFGKLKKAVNAVKNHTGTKATTSVQGHVKLSNSSAVTDSTGLALPATEKNASIDGTLANQIANIRGLDLIWYNTGSNFNMTDSYSENQNVAVPEKYDAFMIFFNSGAVCCIRNTVWAEITTTNVLNINSSTYDLVWAKRKFYINNTTPNRVITFEPCYYRAFAAGSSYKLANGTCIPLRIYGIKG